MLNVFKAEAGNVKLFGRTHMHHEVLWCAFSASGIEFVSRGKSVAVTLYGDSSYADPENVARYAIYVDGEIFTIGLMDCRRKNITITDDDEEAVHVIRILKLSESAMSTMGIGEIAVMDGDIIPTSDNEFFIEYVGDSITCGYGVEDEEPENHFHTYTENVTKSFSYVSAQLLGVDHSMVSFSGYGVISGYTADGKINDIELLPPHYEKLGFSYAVSGTEDDTFKVQDVKWDFSGRKPEMVIINLGTNDMSYTGEDEEKQKAYRERYKELLRKIRSHYPDTYFLCILGMMGDLLYPSLQKAVCEYKEESGDIRIETMHIDPIIQETEGYVADYHPTTITHNRAAAQVAQRAEEIALREYGVVLGNKMTALSFDDGPNTEITPGVLDVLEEKEAKGTFFLVGNNINSESEKIVSRAFDLGFEIENHSISHSVMSEMSVQDFLGEINENSDNIKRITGRYPKFFRPPYIAVNELMRENIELTMIAGYGCEDWLDTVSENQRAQRILAQLKSGRIILLHDMPGNIATVKALNAIIDIGKKLGYSFVTIEDMFEKRHVIPKKGIVYNEAE